jgi:NAD(P)-dependent dehydrogenase (short-subunit alcohol dehydrogenase family)
MHLLVTGGGRGIGAAVAREVSGRGYRVALMSPSESCETLAAELGGVARRGVAQSTDDLKGIVDLAMATYGRIDAVLNHTGHPPKGELLEITDDDWDLANEMIVKFVVRHADHGRAGRRLHRQRHHLRHLRAFALVSRLLRLPRRGRDRLRRAARRADLGGRRDHRRRRQLHALARGRLHRGRAPADGATGGCSPCPPSQPNPTRSTPGACGPRAA